MLEGRSANMKIENNSKHQAENDVQEYAYFYPEGKVSKPERVECFVQIHFQSSGIRSKFGNDVEIVFGGSKEYGEIATRFGSGQLNSSKAIE